MINKAVLVGRVGGEPESKYTPQGSHVISFSVATNKKWKDQSGQQHDLKMLGGKKENAKPHVPQHANNSFVSDDVPF
ncbi:MAG: hypothetical protein EBU35_11600 [Marivivens sp.]|nr:hypothetical protein [Marivivens sp.]